MGENKVEAKNTHRFQVLDSFRGIAAIMVVLYHLETNGYISNLNIVKNSYLFVDFFFVLSGFVISYGYINKINNKTDFIIFIKKRFSRIYPLHFFVLLCFIPFALINLIMHINLGERFSLYSFINNVFLIQALGLNRYDSWNIPSWSISTEFYTYIFWSFVIIFLNKSKILISSIISIFSLVILYKYSNMGDTNYLAIFRCTYSFFLGVIAFYLYKKIKSSNLIELILVFIFIIWLSFEKIPNNSLLAYLSPILFFFIILVFSKEKGILSIFLKHNFFEKLGVLSFSIYLIHTWFITLLKAISQLTIKFFNYSFVNVVNNVRVIDFGFPFLNDLIFLPFLFLILFFSKITYHYIEIRFQQKLTKILTKEK